MSVVLINPFGVSPEDEQAFVDDWHASAATFAQAPGYFDTRLYRSLDPRARFRFVNIAHWADEASWRSAMRAAPPKEGGVPGVEANPALYEPLRGGAVEAQGRTVEAELRDIEHALARAYLESDAAWLERMLDGGYVVTDGPGSTSDKHKVLADHRDDRLRVAVFSFDEIEVRTLSPDAAFVTGRYRWAATYDGRAIEGPFRYLRLYARGGDGGWRIRAAQVTPVLGS